MVITQHPEDTVDICDHFLPVDFGDFNEDDVMYCEDVLFDGTLINEIGDKFKQEDVVKIILHDGETSW